MNRNNKHLQTLRRLTALMLAAVFLWAVALPAFAEGTEAAQSDTVYINSASDLVSFAQRCAVDSWSKGKTVILQEDLSLQGVAWEPIPSFSGNLFVSDTLRGIDRLSKAGQAEPTDYETLIALENAPKRFGQITVTFKDEDHVLGRVNLEYGDSLDESGYPELPAKEGCAARWSTTKLTDLHLDTVVEAVYTDYITALASIYEREDGRPVFFAKESFGDRDSLTVSVRDLPGELRNAVESWQLTIPDDGQESHTVRYLPIEVGKKYKVYAKQDGSWKQRSTETIGSYLAFDLPGNTAELAVVPGSSVPVWVIVTAAAAVVLAGGTVLIRRRKKAPVKQTEE